MVAQVTHASRIVIDEEFREWLTPLTDDEYAGLEKSILDEGCRDPLVVWRQGLKDVLADGHNRYEICTRHGIEFDIVQQHFDSREQAKNWIIDNQFAKRNLSPEQRNYLIGKRYNELKQPHGGDRKVSISSGNSYHLKTEKVVAGTFQVADKTVRNAAKFAAAVDTIADNVGKEVKDKILTRKINATQKDIQQIASKPKKEQKEIIKRVESGKAKSVAKAVTQMEKERRVEESAHIKLPKGCRIVSSLNELISEGATFPTIYGDPAWRYGNQSTRAATDNHYETMTVDEICEMPVAKLAAKNAHLHLWVTKDFLFEGKRVLEAWGFEYKSIYVWAKPELGIGNYWRMSTEFMLLGLKGDLKFQNRAQRNWDEIPRGEHSVKPEEVRKKIQLVSPGPYLELFGRMAVPGWTIFGNQVWTPDGERNMGPIEGPLFGGK